MGQFTKKLVSTVVTMSTVLSSVGVGAFAVPSVASAATLMNGDLIKASGPAVYYFFNNKRYVFPNETTYRSWFADFSGIRSISDSELSAIMIGGNITIRPGTNLIKITTDPKVYAVTRGGVLRWVESESVANALYGSNWARRVVDVPDQLFVNYSVGSSVSTAVHPDGSLVSYAGSSDRYVVWNGQRRMISDSAFAANMFNSMNVLPTTISYPMGANVTTREAELADAVVGGGSTTPVSGSVTVSLASDTSPAMVVPKNAHNVMFTKVNLMAGTASTVTSLKFRRVGVGLTTDFDNVYLYKADGTRLTSGRTLSSSDNTVTFSGLNLSIGAGMTESVYLSGDIGITGSEATGGQHAFEIADAGSVVLSGTGTVAGSFPVRGNAMTIGTASVARVDVIDGSEPANPRVGTTDAELANFRLQANGSNDIEVRRVTLYQAGTVSNSDLSNLRLFQGSTQVASAASVMSDGKIVLNFTTPFAIPNGQSRTFTLRGGVAGRSSRTIRIYTEYSSDVYAVDKVQNVGAQVCVDSNTSPCNGSYDGSSSTTTNASYSTTEGGQFTITYNGPATANVGRGQNDVVFYRFAITSGSNEVEVRKFNFAVTTTVSGIYDGTTEYLRDIKIKDADTGETVAGPVSCTSSCAAPGYRAFDSGSVSVRLAAGQTRNFVITADTSNSITDGSTYVFSLGSNSGTIFGSTDVRVTSSGEFLATSQISPNSTVTGNTMTVRTPTLNVTLAGTPSSGVFVKNQANIPATGFTLTAGSQSAVRMTSLKVTGQGDLNAGASYTAAELDDVVNSCGLYDGETMLGSRQSPSTDGTMTFSGLSYTIARGGSKTLEVRCTSDSTISNSSGDRFSLGIAATSDISAQDEDGNTVTLSSVPANSTPSVFQTVRANGTVTIAANSQPASTILVADGSTWQVLARYSANALYEDVTVDYVGVTSTGPAANFAQDGVAVAQSTDPLCRTYTVRGTTSLSNGVSQAGEIDISANPITIAKGSTTYVCLLAKLAATVPSSTNADTTAAPRSGNVVALGIPAGNFSIGGQASTIFTSSLYSGNLAVRSTGAASGERIYQTAAADIEGNSHVVRKAKLVITNQNSGLSTTLASGQRSLYRAQIGTEGGQAALKQLAFKVTAATTSQMTIGNFRLQKNGSDMNLSDIEIQSAYGVNLESSTLDVHVNPATSTFVVLVRFTNEEVVSGSGNTYTLMAQVSGLSSTTGDSINTALAQRTFSGTVAANAITGWLATSTAQLTIEGAGTEPSGLLSIATSTNPGAASSGDYGYAILWSDMSEQPHYSSIHDSGSSVSRDWTNEYLVDTISGSHVMSK
jgi:hypothetical protein